MDYGKIKSAILNTGFPLEFQISSILKKHGWQTINNRYYIDDVKEIEREIDILAYKHKIDRDNKICFFTTLIISCKKSNTGLWTFFSTEKPTYDPNFMFFVMANKTSDKRLEKMLKLKADDIERSFCSESGLAGLFKINRKTFGFQQLNKDSYKCEDDKKIYDSIITAIKALEYEISIKPNNKKITSEVDTTFYNFNLLSIFDGEMAEVYFEEEMRPESVDNIIYINRHIINKTEKFYKVHFIKSSKFEDYLNLYDKLNQVNFQIFDKLIEDYYSNIFECKEKTVIYWKEFSKSIEWLFNYTLKSKLNFNTEHPTDSFDFEYDNGLLKLYYNGYWDVYESEKDSLINREQSLIDLTKKMLLKYFRYSGNFSFEEEALPF